jgi:heme exporter protein A
VGIWSAGAKRQGFAAMKLSGLDLTCVRGGRRVFDRINFSLAAGKALILTGPNGAGKSSLLRMIAGLIHPAEGRLALEGGDTELSIGEQAHYVGHLDPLKPALTVKEPTPGRLPFGGATASLVACPRADGSTADLAAR